MSANWSNLTDYSRNKDEITQLIVDPLDRSLRAMKDNLASQEFIVDDTGILGRKKEKSGDFSSEQLRIVNNTLIFTKDNWNTAALALGKVGDKYGLVADVVVGTLVMGEELQIKNRSNSISLNENGILIKKDDENVFKASTDGDVYIKGQVEATSGKIGNISISSGAITSANDNFSVDANGNLIASNAILNGKVTATSGTIGNITINSDGSIISANKNFSVDAKGNLGANNATLSGTVTATDGKIGGFTIGKEAIYNIRNSLNSTEATGVYLGTDGISLGYDTSLSSPKIYASADGVFRALNAQIFGQANLTHCRIDGNLSVSGQCAMSNFSASNITTGTIEFADAGLSLKTGEYEGTRVTAKVEGFFNDTITVTCMNSSGNNHNLAKKRSFVINWSGSSGIFGSGSGSVTVTVPAGSHTGSASTGKNFNSYDTVFAVSGTDTTTFSDGGTGAFTFNGNLMSTANMLYTLGTPERRWKTIYGAVEESGSDKKIKSEIEPLSEDMSLNLIKQLVPKTYKFRDFNTPRMRAGFIAQEVEEALNSIGMSTEDWALVSKTKPNEPDGEDNLYSLEYKGFIAPIVKVLQVLIKKIEKLDKR